MFEEDDGFIYKRSQDIQDVHGVNDNHGVHDTHHQGPTRKLKTVSTPISNLNKALDSLSSPNYVEHFDFDTSTKKVGKLSSPIRPRYDQKYDSSSDDYIEQVSHHTIDLMDDTSHAKKHKPNDRRSSYLNRGKRLLSIGNGLEGVPHEDVPSRDFFKLLDTSLPEPHRMKQLLVWCIDRKLKATDKSGMRSAMSDNINTYQVAEVIKKEVLTDLKNGDINTSWYNKSPEDSSQGILGTKEILLPNPLNQATQDNIKKFNNEIRALKREKVEWQKVFDQQIKPLNGFVDFKSGIHKDEIHKNENHKEKFLLYFKHKNKFDQYKQILDESLVNDLERTQNEIISKYLNKAESSINELFNLTHKLLKMNEIVDHYKNRVLTPKIEELSTSFFNKSKVESSGEGIWPPHKTLVLKDILNGMVRLDEPQT